MKQQVDSKSPPMTSIRGLFLYICGFGLLSSILIGLGGIIHFDGRTLIASLVLGVFFGPPFGMALTGRPRSLFLSPSIGSLFQYKPLRTTVIATVNGAWLCVFLSALYIVSLAVNHLGSSIMDAVLVGMAAMASLGVFFYRLKPRSLHRLIGLSDMVALLIVSSTLVPLNYWLFTDNKTSDAISRIGYLFLVCIPFLLGMAYGVSYGWLKWKAIDRAEFSTEMSEEDVYQLFFGSHQAASGRVWIGLFVLVLAILKPVAGDAGTMLVILTLGWCALAIVLAVVGIRRYFFWKKFGFVSITIG